MQVSKTDKTGDSGVFGVAYKFTKELGWIFREQNRRDLGIDAYVELVHEGVSQGQLIALQIKSGESWFKEETDSNTIFRFNRDHYEYWVDYPLPVFTILFREKNNTAYWQIVNKDTAISTGKGWKVQIPKSQTVSRDEAKNIEGFCEKVVPVTDYSLMSFKDLSYARAKRYQARVILNKNLTRGEIVQIISKLSNELRNRKYYRNPFSRQAWKRARASVIWLLVYPSSEDERNNNWICQSEWISSNLETEFRPLGIDGMKIGNELTIKWNKHYAESAQFYEQTKLAKEDYLAKVNNILPRVMRTADQTIELTKQYEVGKITGVHYLKRMGKLQSVINKAYRKGINIGTPPIECKDFSVKFQSLIALVDNIVLPFTRSELNRRDEQNRNSLVSLAIKDYLSTLQELKYEEKKLR